MKIVALKEKEAEKKAKELGGTKIITESGDYGVRLPEKKLWRTP